MNSEKLVKSILFGVVVGVASAALITFFISLIFEEDFVRRFLALDGGIMWSIALSVGNSIWFYNREKDKK